MDRQAPPERALLAVVSVTLLTTILIAGCGRSHVAPQEPASPQPGWRIEGRSKFEYAARVDTAVTRNGKPTLRFQCRWASFTHDCFDGPCPTTYAALVTSRDAVPFRGRRVRAVAWIRTADDLAPDGSTVVYAHNVPEVLAAGGGYVALRVAPSDEFPDGPWTNTSVRALARNTEFTRYELVVDVPEDAYRVEIAVTPLSTLWIDPDDLQIDSP